MVSTCPGRKMTVRDGGAQNCQSITSIQWY